MSWILKSKRLQSAGQGTSSSGSNSTANNNNASSGGSNINSIYSHGSSINFSSSSISSSTGFGYGSSSNNLSSVSLTLNSSSGASSQAQPFSLHHHLDAGEDMVRQFAASQLDTQKTAFMRWVNVQLAHASPAHPPMTSIERDLRDGKRLIALLETVANEPLKPEKHNMRIHQMANVSKALAFLEKSADDTLGTIGSEAIVDGNLKLTLGLVWTIIYRFQIQQIANTMAEQYPSIAAAAADDIVEGEDSSKSKKKGVSQQVDAKQALLRWVRLQLEDYSDVIPPMQDFSRSWRTGLAFAALIHRHDPEFLPNFYTTILPLPFETIDECRRTLALAFEVAVQKMNIPRLLDPEDLINVDSPDERSVMTYVSEYYLVMSKHEMEQDAALAAELRAQRLAAKDERLALAGEDEEARRKRLQAEEERRRREEEEELERIRLKRMEIEGWSIRAAERAKEEEEARRKRQEEDAERRLQRKLRREQRERERAAQRSQQHLSPQSPRSTAGTSSFGSVFSDTENDFSDTDTEPIDPREQERRQRDLDEKLAEYHQGIAELSEWIRQQVNDFPPPLDTTAVLDRTKDLEPLCNVIKVTEEDQAIKEHVMSHLHDVREELLEYENPELAPEQVSDMDKKWWELETIWTSLTSKVVEAKDTAEEVKWIIDCSQEIGRVNGEILKFETQLEAFAEKRFQETLQDRSQKSVLEQQDVSLSSISFLLKTYVDFLTSLMDPKVHHYTAPEHLTALNTELTTVRLPHLGVIIEKAQQNLSNDRLLKSFLDSFILSEAWIGESVVWLANIEVPVFVSKDEWNGASTVKEYLTRDVSRDLDLDFFQAEIEELKGELQDERSEVNNFRSSGFAKLDEQAKAVIKALADTDDITAEATTQEVQELMQGVMKNLVKVEDLLPKEAVHCAYAARVLEYLLTARSILRQVESTNDAIHKWEMRQPDMEVEALVITAENDLAQVDSSLKDDQGEPTVRDAVCGRHLGLVSVVKDLRVCFHEKQDAIKGDRQMKEFLEHTLTCQATLRDIRGRLQDNPPWTGFGSDDPTPFDAFTAMVAVVGKSFDEFESDMYASYLQMGDRVKAMAATSNARQDPAIVQSKLQVVSTLLEDIRALKSDRERDVNTLADCRKLVEQTHALSVELSALECDFSALEHLEPNQRSNLVTLCERSSDLSNRFAVLEQDRVFRYLAQDPSCAELLKEIKERQLSIQRSQERLQARLEVKHQWDIAWDAFSERAGALQQYLERTEQETLDRGFATLDCLAKNEQVWRKSQDTIRDTQAANADMLVSLKDFKTSRLPELKALAGPLQRVVDLAKGIEGMDQVRAEQFHESARLQRKLREHLELLHVLNNRERHQIDTLQQRLAWTQQLAESMADAQMLITTGQDAIAEFTQILKLCKQSGDTSDLNDAAANHLEQQVKHLVALANQQKQSRRDAALATHKSLVDLAKASDVVDANSESAIPEHLEDELASFKNQYKLLDVYLDDSSRLAKHAIRTASYLEQMDGIVGDLRSVANELKADSEASRDTIERVSAIRLGLKKVVGESTDVISSAPQPSEETRDSLSLALDAYSTDLELVLKSRLDHTAQLDQSLDPLLTRYQELLEYQDGLRDFVQKVGSHKEWAREAQETAQSADRKVCGLYEFWPGEKVDQDGRSAKESVITEKFFSQISGLKDDLAQEVESVKREKHEFQALKHTIEQALRVASSHSKHLQSDLERSLASTEDSIQELETDMRHRSYHLDCLSKRSAWEQELESAKVWCREFDRALAEFASQDAQWTIPKDAVAVVPKEAPQAVSQLMQRLDASIAEFKDRFKGFEVETKPAVDQSWSDLCASLVFVDRAIPADFQDRQTGLDTECQRLRSKVAFGAEVVEQRKALEGIASGFDELAKCQQELSSVSLENQKDDKNEQQLFEKLESRTRTLTSQLEVDMDSLQYPVEDTDEEAKARSQAANASIHQHIQTCHSRVQTVKDALENVLHEREVSRRQQELEAISRKQNIVIEDKTGLLETISGLLDWAEEAGGIVSGLMNPASQEFKDAVGCDRSQDGGDFDLEGEDHPETSPSMTTLAKSDSNASVSTLVPGSQIVGSLSGVAKASTPISELVQLPQEALHSLSARIESMQQEIEEMKGRKVLVQEDAAAVDQKAATEAPEISDQVDGHKKDASNTDLLAEEPTLRQLEETIEQGKRTISQLDHDIAAKLTEFDTKASWMVESLKQESQAVATALKQRMRLDEERARQLEEERLRKQRALEVQQFEDSKAKFLAWSQTQLHELQQLWDSYGYFGTDVAASCEDGNDIEESRMSLLETGTIRLYKNFSEQEVVYAELKDRMSVLFIEEEHASDRIGHSDEVDRAWNSVKSECIGYQAILKHMADWSELRRALDRFGRDSLDVLESRVEALRWMHWEAFQQEEESLLKFIESAEDRARELHERASVIRNAEISQEALASHRAVLDANRIYCEERMDSVPTRIEAAKSQMQLIHETSKEIALHAKFHADLVRIETAIAQQIDAVRARLGSLERSSCFALNSKALEAVVMAANEVCMDGKYQFSVLQEVEYSALERTAFDLDMLAAEDPSDPEGHLSSNRTSVQESMDRIRGALKELENLIEEDCFETLLAAKLYTHSKATEDIRQWITACRDSMSQLNKTEPKDDKERRQQTKEWKMKHLEALEKKLNAFGATVQDYDELSGDFMLLHHPESSSLDVAEQSAPMEEESRPMAMRVILRQTVQERTKRTREDWELLKQEFLAKTAALEEQSSEDEGNGADTESHEQGTLHAGSTSGTPVMKAKTLSRFGTEILEDIARVSREIQEMFDHGLSSHSTLSLAVESDGALVKSKEGQARLEMVEAYIRDVLQTKVERFDAMLSAANEQSEQEHTRQASVSQMDVSTRDHMRHHEKMVGVAMQRGLIAESMNRLVESCHHQRKEVEETARVQNAMDLIHETSLLCDSMTEAIASADSLLQPVEGTLGGSFYNLSAASSTSSLASITGAPTKSPAMSPSGTVSRATAVSRQRRASRISSRRSFSLSSMNEEAVHEWESNYRSLMEKFDGYTTDIEKRLDMVSAMADRLNDWRLDESYGVASEHWQKVKSAALSKKQELDRVWARRPGSSQTDLASSIHPLEGAPTMSPRPSVMQPTASSNNRVKAILGSPVEPAPIQGFSRRKRFSTGNIMARGTFVPPSPTPSNSGTSGRATRSVAGRVRSGTAPGLATISQVGGSQPDLSSRKYATIASPSLHAMTPTFSQEAKRRPPIIRKNDSTSSISSNLNLQDATSPTPRLPKPVYQPDMSNALDVEVAKVVNASGFTMKVQKLREGQSNLLSPGSMGRHRSDSTSSLALSGLSDNGGYDGADSTNSSPRVAKTVRGQGRLGSHAKTSSTPDAGSISGEVGRYVFGDVEPKVCYCRILRSRKVMVRVGGGWSELSKFMEDHASLEQRKAKSRLLSASSSSVSVASHYGGSTTALSGNESRQHPRNISSDSLSDNSQLSGSVDDEENNAPRAPRIRKKKEMVYHIRPSDDLSLKTIKFVKNGAGEALLACE
ncbi:Spectrin beta chain, non-erythrocytic 2 [Mortierella alpina]|nr:Spectrin beta chain, non-erythrocytic 2 [Mortierella alpina]